MTKELRTLRPWIIGALIWLMLSLVVSLEHLRSAQPDYLFELGGLMSLIWFQFGFAGLFNTLKNEQGRRALLFLFVTFIPPLILYCINYALLW
ncbi:MAG: hypothetical protein KDI43_01765 [Gammaproteobacteria bacterium]|nr:hypothetical protein [Gammaproteobacteria bacterium]MCP5406646.1 hypothetical protein [Chromatiaceae bacterium]MCP5444374.1 hypothetical protein [Chromatiaceae bacterium]